MARVTLMPTGDEFFVSEDEDILTAVLHQGINLQYGCRHGNCSSCKHWLIDGDVDDSAASVYAIPRSEREDGAILLCCTYARSDLVIEINQHDGVEELPPMALPGPRMATVLKVSPLTPLLVELRVAIDQPLSFRAGQYAEFTVANSGERRSYSFVNPPRSSQELVFCIKRISDGVFGGVLDRLVPGSRLNLEAPFGTMFLRETGRPVLAVGIGSGIAPILSILSDAADQGVDVPIRFYYGARTAGDLVYLDEIADLSARLHDFQFIPCLSQTSSDAPPDSRAGRVTRAIAEDIRDASAWDAYLCGAPEMCDAVGRLLEAKGMPEARIHADRFYPAVESAQVPA
ncbi:MAG: 2Fe-2S iron-sulfur cluster-binding protein [Mycobacteriaceae bacterium]